MPTIRVICDNCRHIYDYDYTEEEYEKSVESDGHFHVVCASCGADNIPIEHPGQADKGGVLKGGKLAVGTLAFLIATISNLFTDARYFMLVALITAGIILTIINPYLFFIPLILVLALILMYRSNSRA